MRDLIAVGELMLDVQAPALRPGNAVHGPLVVRAGGSPVNTARAAASIGAQAAVVGRVGADAAGRLIRDDLAAATIEALLSIDPSLPTGTFLEAGDAIAADRGANAALAAEHLPTPLAARVVLVSAYAPPGAARGAVVRAQAEWIVGPGGNAYVGSEPPPAGSEYRLTCLTFGADGATATLDGLTEHRTPAERVAGRATGAGDAFAAGLLIGLTRGMRLGEALELGCSLGLRTARTRARAETASAES